MMPQHSNRLSRRALLKGGAASAMGFGLVAAGAFEAQALTQTQTIPGAAAGVGVYRFKVGDFQVTSLGDGSFPMAPAIFGANTQVEFVEAVLKASGLPYESIAAALNITLVQTGEMNILFDTGALSLGPSVGQIFSVLGSLEVGVDDIDAVCFTHAHPDHIGGVLAANRRPMFPNATHYMAQRERDHWFGLPPGNGGGDFAKRQLNPVRDATVLFEEDQELLPGVSSVTTPGHTPGHTAYLLESAGEQLMVTGDVANHHVISLKHPEWHLAVDDDGDLASETRIGLFNRIAEQRIKMLAYHFPFPGVGYLNASDTEDSWTWVPSV